MQPLALCLLLAHAGAAEPDKPPSPPEPAAPAAARAAASGLRPIGVGLAAGGAVLAAGSTVGFTLVEALTTPDRQGVEPSAAVASFTQASGFVAAAVASVSAVLLVVGGGLILVDEVPSSTSNP